MARKDKRVSTNLLWKKLEALKVREVEKMNDIQKIWISIAEELERKKENNSEVDESILEWMIKENKDKFIKLAFDSQKTKLAQHQFNIDSFDSPEKPLHDRLFRLASAFLYLSPSNDLTQTLITKLTDSLMGSFSL